MEALRIDGGVGFSEGLDRGGLVFCNLIKGLPFLDGIGSGLDAVGPEKRADAGELK